MAETIQNAREITLLLNQWKQGDAEAFDKLTQYVYDDLKHRAASYMRNQRPGHTLQTTGLVHEAFIRLIDKNEIEWQDRQHFMAVASVVMRNIIIDYARQRNRDKRGGKNNDVPLDEANYIGTKGNSPVNLIDLDEALKRLASFDERQSKIVELKYFGGLTLEEIGGVLGISTATVKRDWNIARAWLRQQLE
ncbi:MAG: sigma-70 family RNA polymerase sigma factor [Acidobacteria bacterium]|nr:sigma-70 family RNA polymerase sigma factor [Acidobacteriota bacterium]